MPGATTFLFGSPRRKFLFRAMGHFMGLTIVFGRFGLVSLCYSKYPYFWTVVNETWRNRPGHQKNDTQWEQTRAGIMEKRPFFTFGQKVFFLAKNAFFPKKHPKFLKRLIFILEKGTFFFEQLFLVLARTRLESRCGFILGPKSGFLAWKSDFCHMTPI